MVKETEIIYAYCGYLFTGHYIIDQFLEHYQTFVPRFGLNSDYIHHIGMDGLNVNLAFKNSSGSIFRMSWVSHFFHLGHAYFILPIQHLEKDLRHCHLTLTVNTIIIHFFQTL